MHFASAVKLVVGLRVAVVTNGAIVVSSTSTLVATTTANIPYAFGFILGTLASSIVSPFLLFVVTLFAISSGGNSPECENWCDAVEQFEQDYAVYREQQAILDEEYDSLYQEWSDEQSQWDKDYNEPWQSCRLQAYWNAIKVDVECRGWQPGDLIPTK